MAATAGDPTPTERPWCRCHFAESDVSKVLCAVFEDRGEVTEMARVPVGTSSCGWRMPAVGGDRATLLQRRRNRHQSHERWRPVRYFRLAGTAKMPETVEMVDTVPAGFAGY